MLRIRTLLTHVTELWRTAPGCGGSCSQGRRACNCVTNDAALATITQLANQPEPVRAGNPAYEMTPDLRELFVGLRAAWLAGASAAGELDDESSWRRASEYAYAAIKSWSM